MSGTVVDRETGVPVPLATVDITTAWEGFPKVGCRIGKTFTDATGRFAASVVGGHGSVVVMLVTGAGRAPTIADRTYACLFGACTKIDERIEAPSAELAEIWRDELYAGGMAYALNRGLVVYRFENRVSEPSSGVSVKRMRDNLIDTESRSVHLGSEARFLAADGIALENIDRDKTTESGALVIGSEGDDRGYFRIGGDRPDEHWPSVGVIVATGWIYTETGHP